MSQWLTVTLRCWVAFIAFTNFGAAFRCFTEDNFVHSKFFGNNLTIIESNEGQVMERMYGFWSLINGIILLNTFFFIEEIKILILSICVIVFYLSFFAVEGYFYKTILLHGPTIYPCTLNGLTLLWLLISLRFPAKKTREEFDENEVLRRQFHFKSVSRKMQ
ncbi:uncharacterized protein [Parasteatoda tepidariorum]|uniref:uncharacterized protein n=1 Tax=Parasteatoda tepidariorum TaxID=114398 RepID=UPI00077FDDD0|nr:uncharacterized protein LOC107456277 [Parasteatoda tepidariorum]